MLFSAALFLTTFGCVWDRGRLRVCWRESEWKGVGGGAGGWLWAVWVGVGGTGVWEREGTYVRARERASERVCVGGLVGVFERCGWVWVGSDMKPKLYIDTKNWHKAQDHSWEINNFQKPKNPLALGLIALIHMTCTCQHTHAPTPKQNTVCMHMHA